MYLPLFAAIVIPTINGTISAKYSGSTSRRADNVLARKLSRETKLPRILAVSRCARYSEDFFEKDDIPKTNFFQEVDRPMSLHKVMIIFVTAEADSISRVKFVG